MRRDIWLASLAGVVVGSWLTLIAVQVEEYGRGLPNKANIEAEAESRPAVTVPARTETAKATPIPATTTPVQTTAETAKQEVAPAAETKPDDKTSVQPAAVAEQTTQAATTAPSTAAPGTIDNGNQTPATTPSAAATTSTPEDTAKALLATGADQIDKGTAGAAAQSPTQAESKTSTESAQPKTTPANPGATQSAQATPTKTNTTQAQTAEAKKTKPDKAAPKPETSDQTNVGQTPVSQGPADQADRELAASAHRTAPTEPASQQASLDSGQKPNEQAKPVELVRPFSDRAGVLTIAGKRVQLPGIIPTDVDRMCTGPNGKTWPCGAAARTAFRMYLRGRTIDCDLPSPTWQGTVTGACRYVRIDLSEWLVRFGWAEPEAGSPLVALAEQAKQQKRGIYGDDPRPGGKSTLAPALPKEDPLNPI